MSYGLKVWDANGNLTLDTTHKITRLVYTKYLNAGTTGSVEIPEIYDIQVVLMVHCVNPSWSQEQEWDYRMTALDVNLVGATLSWAPHIGFNGLEYGQDTIVYIFAYK